MFRKILIALLAATVGLVVVGGLMFSQLITLYLTPVFYTYMAALQAWLNRKEKKTGAASEPVHA